MILPYWPIQPLIHVENMLLRVLFIQPVGNKGRNERGQGPEADRSGAPSLIGPKAPTVGLADVTLLPIPEDVEVTPGDVVV